jgi:hypothetical protein
MELAESSSPAEASRVAVRLPPFWAERPALWFAQAEAQFFLAGISSERTKFFQVISQLDHRYAAELEDIITSPPERDPYTTLRTELVRRLSPSREQRIRQFLTLEMGNRKPSQFLRHLRSLVPDVPDDVLPTIWSSRIPLNIQAFLACQLEGSLNTAARCADRISEVTPQPALASSGPPPDSSALLQEIEDLSRQVAALTAEQDRPRSTSRNPCYSPSDPSPISRNRRPSNRYPSYSKIESTPCWYHRRYGAGAQKCTQPYAYRQQRETMQQTSPAAHVCATSTVRLFITERITKWQFLVDTVSDFCVYPCTLVPRRKERVNYDLCAANDTTIHKYG